MVVVWAARDLNLGSGAGDWYGDRSMRGVRTLMVSNASLG